MKVLYISELNPKILNGGSAIERRNCDTLKKYYDVEECKVYAKGRNLFRKIVDVLTSKVSTLYSRKEVKDICYKIRKSEAKLIFIETSKMGYFAKIAKKYDKMVVVFLHNCESVLYKNSRGSIYVPLIKKQEKLSLDYADSLIYLNERDKNDFHNIYKIKRDINEIVLPITLKDELTSCDVQLLSRKTKDNYGLFLGSNFPPNYNGIKWFVDNVAPYINGKIKIVGLDFENCPELNRDNVIVVGTVNSTREFLIDADYYICPIFEGSGMKVKTCSGLMYGKKIFATDEALQGYDLNPASYVKCNSSKEFIEAINTFISSKEDTFNISAREDYLEKYSLNGFEKKLSDFITKTMR